MTKPLLIDVFLYNGEADMLELRYCELKDKVDVFVAVQGSLTFTGKPKPVYNLYPQILNYVVSDFPEASPRNAWKREMWQRNKILDALRGQPGDAVVMVSDVDEVPRADMIPTPDFGQLWVLVEDTYHFNFNNQVVASGNGFQMGMCTRVCRLSDLFHWYPQGVRNMDGIQVRDSGWHFSWMGADAEQKKKAESYSHVELKNFGATYAEQVQNRWSIEYKQMSGLKHLPACVQSNPQRWSQYLAH